MYRIIGSIVSGIAICVCLATIGCSTHNAQVNYDGIEEFRIQASPFLNGKALGKVKGKHGGPVWDNGSYIAQTAVWKMIKKAKEMDANAIGDIRWRDGASPDPRYRKKWLSVVFFPLLMTSFFQNAEVHGTAYSVEETESAHYLLPEDPVAQQELARRIVRETLETSRS